MILAVMAVGYVKARKELTQFRDLEIQRTELSY
jgi:hypothetical protein